MSDTTNNEMLIYESKQIEEVLNVLNQIEIKTGILNAQKLVHIVGVLQNSMDMNLLEIKKKDDAKSEPKQNKKKKENNKSENKVDENTLFDDTKE